ncbi:MAG TPA: AMP-binding protein, partial [Burkholderiaceae bacterium]|nr:AMP-binding protein [Burkholderiaceae bacterium]
IRIADSGEVQVRSASVFPGYYNDDQATAKALQDGWLHTGDAGYFEPDGQLVVLGRVSEVVHTAAGERYVPNYIENRIKFSPYVRNVAIIGSQRQYLAAIVCIDLDAVAHWAEQRRISYTSYADLSQLAPVRALIGEALVNVNRVLTPGLQVQRFVNLHKDFDPDDGEITRTRKIRRSVIEERYAKLIDALYSDATSVDFEAAIVYESGEAGTFRRSLALMNVGATA